MSNIDTGSLGRRPFFPNNKGPSTTENEKTNQGQAIQKMAGNAFQKIDKAPLLKTPSRDVNVSVQDAVKDFAMIKSAVDKAPEIDNSAKISRLKSQIKDGTYNIDYDALADKLLGESH